jgi:hypothetical protein
MMDLVYGALISSSEKPLCCRQFDQPPFTAIQFLGAYNSPSSRVRKSCSAQRVEQKVTNPESGMN